MNKFLKIFINYLRLNLIVMIFSNSIVTSRDFPLLLYLFLFCREVIHVYYAITAELLPYP